MNTTHSVTTTQFGLVNLTVSESGAGRPFLLLHGGAGPISVAGFGELLSRNARVLVPTHPGFGGTPRPETLKTVPGLAALYVALLDQLDLHDVTVVGNSIGGWIAAEVALIGSKRVSSVVLLDAAGIIVDGHPAADPFTIPLPELIQRSYFEPEKFKVDPSALTDAQRAAIGANRATLAIYGGQPSVGDPTLRTRLGKVAVPTLVGWGEADRVVDVEYGRAYAAAIPKAEFKLLPKSGHLPQIETPEQTLRTVLEFSAAHSA